VSIVGSALAGAVNAAFDAAGQWVAGGAVWLLRQVGHAMSATTSVDVGSTWFRAHYQVMAALAAAVILPMACAGVISAVYRQDASTLVRALLVKLPLALLFTGISVELVRMGLAVTDELSGRVLAAGGVDTGHLLAPVGAFLAADAVPSGGTVPAFVVFVGALLVAMASLLLWLELVVRAAAVAAATLFLPLALAALVWPAVSHWCRRLAETIAALVLSKLVVAAVLSLAAGALAGGVGGMGSGDVSGGFAAVVTGIALLFIATTAPFLLLRLVPAVEAGAVLHLEGARHRLQQAPVRAGMLALDLAGGSGMLAAGAVPSAQVVAPEPAPGTAGGLVMGGADHEYEEMTAAVQRELASDTGDGDVR
jgi:hypothetical protein